MKKLLEKDDELNLARAWLGKGCERSRARLVDAYQPMIRRIARRHLRSGLDMDDLVQEGTIGFMGALDNFDPERGFGVGTLARFHIAARIQLYVAEFTGIIRLPNSRRIKGLLSNCVSRIRYLENELGRQLTSTEKSEICKDAGFDYAELEQYEMVMRPVKSLAQKSDSDEDESVHEPTSDTDTEAEVASSQSSLKAMNMIEAIMADFPERTRAILAMRHVNDDFMSLDKIAEQVGISRERVRRIEMDALAVIKSRLSASGINDLSDVI